VFLLRFGQDDIESDHEMQRYVHIYASKLYASLPFPIDKRSLLALSFSFTTHHNIKIYW
jgi:hypothetical protein